MPAGWPGHIEYLSVFIIKDRVKLASAFLIFDFTALEVSRLLRKHVCFISIKRGHKKCKGVLYIFNKFNLKHALQFC